jgi:hypothetical protein
MSRGWTEMSTLPGQNCPPHHSYTNTYVTETLKGFFEAAVDMIDPAHSPDSRATALLGLRGGPGGRAHVREARGGGQTRGNDGRGPTAESWP